MGKNFLYHPNRHLSVRGLNRGHKAQPLNVIAILRAPIDEVREESNYRLILDVGLILNLQRLGINSLDELLQLMRHDQSVLDNLGQRRLNEIMRVFKKLGIDL